MPLTITPINYSKISGCEGTSDGGTWTANAIAAVGDFKREGTNCLGATIRAAGNNDINLAGTFDLSGIKHLRVWFMFTNISSLEVDDPATPAQAGIQFYVGDATNTAYYKVSGKTSYPGGWYPLVVDLSGTPDAGGTKPSNMAACTKVGIRVYLPTGVAKNVQNCWWDFLIYCDGLQCSGTPQYGLDTIWALDDATTGAWGIVRKIGGVYYLLGSLNITTDFKDTSQAVVFENRKVNAALYEIKTTTANGVFQIGNKAGSAGVSGCTIRTQAPTQTPKFKITCTDTNVDTFKLYGSTFFDGGVISLPLTETNREVINCSFEKCVNVLPQTIGIKYSNFITHEALSLSTSSIENSNFISGSGLVTAGGGLIKNCSFIAPAVAVALLWNVAIDTNTKLDGTAFTSSGTGHAIQLGANCPAEITLTNVIFTYYGDNETTNACIYNNSQKAIKINIAGGTLPTVRNEPPNSSTEVVYGATLTVTGIQPSSEVQVFNEATGASLASTETQTGGVTKAAIQAGGTGYAVDDILTVVGGTYTVVATLKVTAVSGGVITGISINAAGTYTNAPDNPVNVTGGGGSGAKFTLTFGGTFTYPFSIGSIVARIFVFHLKYVEVNVTGIPLDSNRSVPIMQRGDRVYANP